MKTKKRHLGITLLELTVVLAIIALMAAAFFVVRRPVEDKAKIEQTKATIQLLCAALEQYHNFYGEFPDPNSKEINYFSGDCDGELDDPNKAERLAYRLSLCPEAQTVLNQINPKMVRNKEPKDDVVEYVDAWGMEFKYEYVEGWNFPLITSKGPDGKDHYDGKIEYDDDNITSQK